MLTAIRQWVIKTMMKSQTGVVRTLPKREIIELNTQITAERMMRNGINPNDLKTVGQVENVVNQIDTPKANVNTGVTGVKKADVLDMEGNKIPEGSGIMGGKAVKESDAAIKARLDADNEKGIAGIKNNRMLDEDEIAELDMDIGGLEYTNDFDGTVGSANKLRKERKQYIADMELEYKKGNLDPEPGEANRERFLQQKFDEMEASGDNRLMTRDEVEELSSFDLQRDMDKSVKKFKKKDAKQKKTLKDFDPEDRDPSADGGRIGLKAGMTKRAFMKLMGGVGASIGAAKSGIFSGFGKGAGKTVAKEVAQQTTSSMPPPYFFKLAEKIKKMGDDVTKGASTQEREVVTSYKDYMMTEDLGTGNIVIRKRNEGVFYDQDGIVSDEYIIYKPGQADELTKGKKPPAEYDEYTVRPDGDGKLTDSEDGLDNLDEILEEVGDSDSMTIKKASGGLAYMLGE